MSPGLRRLSFQLVFLFLAIFFPALLINVMLAVYLLIGIAVLVTGISVVLFFIRYWEVVVPLGLLAGGYFSRSRALLVIAAFAVVAILIGRAFRYVDDRRKRLPNASKASSRPRLRLNATDLSALDKVIRRRV